MFAPKFFLSQFTSVEMPPVTFEFIRWYGVLLWVLTFVVLRILPMKEDRVLAPAVEALLFGDIVHLYAIYMFYQAVPEWSFSFIIMLFFTSFLAIVRSFWVYRFHKQTL